VIFRAHLKTVLALGMFVLILYPIFSVVRFVIQRSRPGRLTIHCNPSICADISVSKEEFPPTIRQTKTKDTVVVSPVSYGPYNFDIRLADGHRFRTGYYHLDAGERKVVDVYIEHPTVNTVHLKAMGYDDNSLIDETTLDLKTYKDNPPYLLSHP
jgi:hypothetical protein